MSVKSVSLIVLLVAAMLLAACAGLAGEPEVVGSAPTSQEQRATATAAPTLEVAETEEAAADSDNDGAAVSDEADSEDADVAEVVGTIGGQVRSGTGGVGVPPDLAVTLHVIDDSFNEDTRETTADAEGRYLFEDIPIREDLRYYVTAFYGNGFFVSAVMRGEPSSGALELPLTIYDVTSDSSVVTITRMLTQFTTVPEGLQVVQVVNFRNNSDRLYLSDEVVEEFAQASVRVHVPAGATRLALSQSGQRYAISEDGRTIIDTMPLFPDESHPVHVSYLLPGVNSVEIELPVDYRVEGPVDVLVPETLTVSSDQLAARGTQNTAQTTYRTYGADLSLAANDTVRYELRPAGTEESSPSLLLAGALIVLGGVVALGAGGLYLRGRRAASDVDTASDEQMVNELIRQIAELDDQHDAAEIDDADYREQRGELKARLSELMGEG